MESESERERGERKQVVSKTIEAHTARSAFIYSVWAVSHASLTALWPFSSPPLLPCSFFTHCMPEWSRKTCHHHHQREINLNGHEAVCWALLPLRFFCLRCLLFLYIFLVPFLPLLLLLLGFCGCFTRLNRPELSAGNCNCDWLGVSHWNWSPSLGLGLVFWHSPAHPTGSSADSLPTALLIMRLSKLQNVLTSGLVALFWLLSLLPSWLDQFIQCVGIGIGFELGLLLLLMLMPLSEPFCVPASNSSSFIWC